MEYEKESRKSTGVALVLAVYAASRLFYPMAGGTHTLGGSRKSPHTLYELTTP